MCTDVILRSDDHSSAGVVDAGSVTSGNGAVLLECGSQLSQTLEGGVGTAVLVGIENNGFLLLLDLNRDDFVLEATGGDGLSSLHLRLVADLVLHLTGDAVLFSNVLSGDTHVVLIEHVKYAVVNHHVYQLDIVHASAPTHIAGDVGSTGHRLHNRRPASADSRRNG